MSYKLPKTGSVSPAAPPILTASAPFSSGDFVGPVKKQWYEKPGLLGLCVFLFWPIFLLGMYYNGQAAIKANRTPWYEKTELLVISALFWPLCIVGIFSSRKISALGKRITIGVLASVMAYSIVVVNTQEKATTSTDPAINIANSSNAGSSTGVPGDLPEHKAVANTITRTSQKAGSKEVILKQERTEGNEAEAFYHYVEDGDVGKVRSFLKRNPSLSNYESPEDGMTVLQSAANNLSITKLLLASGANVHAAGHSRNLNGQTPLILAVNNYINEDNDKDGFEIIKTLVGNRANVNEATKDGTTSLHLLASMPPSDNSEKQEQAVMVARYLLKHGAIVDVENNAEVTPLLSAASTSNIPMARLLLQNGANPNKKGATQYTALDLAGDDSVLKSLIRSYGGTSTLQ